MPRQLRTGAAASSLAQLALPLIVGGCGAITESNEAACRRAARHVETCLMRASGAGFGVSVSKLCEGPIEPVDPNLSAVVDCVTSLSCSQMAGGAEPGVAATPECAAAYELVGPAGRNVLEDLPGFGPSSPSPDPPTCQTLTGYEFCLLSGTCLPDCSDTSPGQEVDGGATDADPSFGDDNVMVIVDDPANIDDPETTDTDAP